MFVIQLVYKTSLSEVDRYLEDHRAFLRIQYNNGTFLASGPCEPRVGGVILASGNDLEAIRNVVAQDPFHVHEIADYKITQFHPTMTADGLEGLLGKFF
jgi:uncharacterized protein YciI